MSRYGLTALAVLSTAFALVLSLSLAACSGPKDTPLSREIELTQQSVKASPGDASLRIRLALLYTDAKRYRDAERELGNVLEEDSGNQAALNAMGALRVAQGKYDQALAPLGHVIELNKNNPMRGFSRELETAHYLLGKAYVELRRFDLAVDSLEMALLIDSTDADAHLLLGMARQRQGLHQEAIKHFGEAVAFVPDFKEAYQAMAASYRALGYGARADYADAMARFSSGSYQEASDSLQNVVRAEQDFVPGLLGLGLAYEKLGRTGNALECYYAVLRLEPDSWLAWQRLNVLRGQ